MECQEAAKSDWVQRMTVGWIRKERKRKKEEGRQRREIRKGNDKRREGANGAQVHDGRWPMGKVSTEYSTRVPYGNSTVVYSVCIVFYRVIYGVHTLDIRRMHGDRPV
mgnify:CR=1 FL=1